MTAAVPPGDVTFRWLDTSDGAALASVARGCPIEADFTFRFDRDPDFFAWPRTAFDRFRYLGMVSDGRVIGYCLLGYRDGWMGDRWGTYGYAGDARILPPFRGERLLERAAVEVRRVVGLEATPVLLFVKRGNRPAERILTRLSVDGGAVVPIGEVEVLNVLPLQGRGPAGDPRVRPVRAADLPALARLCRTATAGRPFAPPITGRWMSERAAELASGTGTWLVAQDPAGQGLLGAVGLRDLGPLRRPTVLRYSWRAAPLRAAHALVRRCARAGVPPLPRPGEAFRALTVTHLAVAGGAPAITRALVAAAGQEARRRQCHLLQLGFTCGDPLLRAVGWLPAQRFRSQVWVVASTTRAGDFRAGPATLPWIDPLLL